MKYTEFEKLNIVSWVFTVRCSTYFRSAGSRVGLRFLGP